MKKVTTKAIIKLVNPKTGACYWHLGENMCETIEQAKRATSKCKDCPSVRKVAVTIARAKLTTALMCGYTRLIEVEDSSRNGVECLIDLPSNIDQAANYIDNLTEV